MSEVFDEVSLMERLSRLEKRGWVVFSLACTERMLPNYRRFAIDHNWGDVQPLIAALDSGWTWLERGQVDEVSLQDILGACQVQAPNTEDFDSVYVSPALDAACAAEGVVRLLLESDPRFVLEIATLAVDTVDMYVQELEGMTPESSDLEERIRLHPLMQAELLNQRSILEAIDRGVSFSEAVGRWRRPDLSNIGLQ